MLISGKGPRSAGPARQKNARNGRLRNFAASERPSFASDNAWGGR